jgi:hypothetical protein
MPVYLNESLEMLFSCPREVPEPFFGVLPLLARPHKDLDSHASRLRRKLNGSAEAAYVLNVWGSATGWWRRPARAFEIRSPRL